jgi:hypothetical protein
LVDFLFHFQLTDLNSNSHSGAAHRIRPMPPSTICSATLLVPNGIRSFFFRLPTAGDVPAHFKVDFWPEPNREDNVFGSKAVGEPPFMLAISVFEALRDAVAQARGSSKDRVDGQAVLLTAPATPEQVLRALSAD